MIDPADVLPRATTTFERSQVQTDGYRVLTIEAPFRVLFDPDLCPEDMLDILAYTWSVDEWEPTWPVERKRNAIRTSPAYHRVKGTRGALERAVFALGYPDLTIEEWFEYDGDPYKFKITLDITDRPFSITDYNQIYRTAIRAKNVRSHLEAVATMLRTLVPGPYLAGAHYTVFRARVFPARPPHLLRAFAIGQGVVLMPVRITVRIDPLP